MSGITFDDSDSDEANLSPSLRGGARSHGMLRSEVYGFANTKDRPRSGGAGSSVDPISSRTNPMPGNMFDQLDKVNRPRSSRKYTTPRGGGVPGCRPQPESVLSPPQGVGGWTNVKTKKVTCGRSLREDGMNGEPFVLLFFREECIRTEEKTTVALTVDQVDLGVKNCCTGGCSAREGSCNKNCKTTFIHQMTLEVEPKSWPAGSCHRLELQPENTPLFFDKQKITNRTIQFPVVCPSKASVMRQCGKAISRTVPSFEWRPARTDAASHSVSWTFGVNTHSDGRRLKFKQHMKGARPVLAISPDHMQFKNNAETFMAKASWELRPNAELEPHRLEWEVKVILHTAVLQSTRFCFSVIDAPRLIFHCLPMS